MKINTFMAVAALIFKKFFQVKIFVNSITPLRIKSPT